MAHAKPYATTSIRRKRRRYLKQLAGKSAASYSESREPEFATKKAAAFCGYYDGFINGWKAHIRMLVSHKKILLQGLSKKDFDEITRAALAVNEGLPK